MKDELVYRGDKDYQRIVNLIKFNLNLMSPEREYLMIMNHSPDYILEKYYHWIGFDPLIHIDSFEYEYESIISTYCEKWGVKNEWQIQNILLFLYSTYSTSSRSLSFFHQFDLMKAVKNFEKYIGPLKMVSSEKKRGLHTILETFSETLLKTKEEDIKILVRDLKINSVIKD